MSEADTASPTNDQDGKSQGHGRDDRLNIADYFLGARIAEGHGDDVAVITEQKRYTYAQVKALADQYGALLRRTGTRAEERVLIAMPDGVDMVAAIFGTLQIGAVAVMVNPELQEAAFDYFLDYTRARVAVTVADTLKVLRGPAAASPHLLDTLVVDRDDFGASLAADDDAGGTHRDGGFETFPTHPDDPAFWLFSGGTTGKPKAVVQSHRSFVNTTECYAKNVIRYTRDDVTISVPKLYFGYATGSNLLFPFAVGASTVLFPDRCTPDTLYGLIERHRPTILINVPTMIGKLLDAPGAEGRDLSSLRLSTSAGEALPEALFRRWMDAFGVEVLDGLGTAEMWHIFLTNHPGDVRLGTLGKPVTGFDVRVRDDHGQDVPQGEVGWLWVRGDSRAQQYWQQSAKSHEAFWGSWYASGDMVRQDEDGYFHYCGRGDDMLKVSGKWLAPKELENCLLQHPRVQEVAVVGIPDASGLAKPYAFVIEASQADDSDDAALEPALQAFARERLEPYKYPRTVVVMDDLPRTHLGKVDRGKLRTSIPVPPAS